MVLVLNLGLKRQPFTFKMDDNELEALITFIHNLIKKISESFSMKKSSFVLLSMYIYIFVCFFF